MARSLRICLCSDRSKFFRQFLFWRGVLCFMNSCWHKPRNRSSHYEACAFIKVTSVITSSPLYCLRQLRKWYVFDSQNDRTLKSSWCSCNGITYWFTVRTMWFTLGGVTQSYRHRLFDSGDDGMHEGLEFVSVVQIVSVSHTHEEKMSGQTRDHMYTNTTRSQIWRWHNMSVCVCLFYWKNSWPNNEVDYPVWVPGRAGLHPLSYTPTFPGILSALQELLSDWLFKEMTHGGWDGIG